MSQSTTLKMPQISASAKENEKIISENVTWQKEETQETRENGSRLLLLVVTGKFLPGCLTFPSALIQ